MQDNLITITGNVCADLVTRRTGSGVDVTSFRLASTPRRLRNGVWEDGDTSYFTVNCWRTLALHVFASVHRGEPVMVHGVLRVRTWENNGAKGTTVEIDAQSVGHDLARGVTVFTRQRRETPSADPFAGQPLAAEAEAAGLRTDSASAVLAHAAA